MHELSLCRSIVHIVDRARGDRPVVAVHVRLGQLRQVVPETLVYCWGLVTETSDLSGSELDVEHVPVVLDCRACGSRTEVAEVLMLTCGTCGAGEVSLVSGEEFLVTSVDLGPAPSPLVPPGPDGRV